METLHRGNLDYVDQLYSTFRNAPESLEKDWLYFFQGMEFGMSQTSDSSEVSTTAAPAKSARDISKEVHVYRLIRAYRDYGHLNAQIDPLGFRVLNDSFFKIENFHFDETDLDKVFQTGGFVNRPNDTLRNIIEHLKNTYCNTLTIQVGECSHDIRAWIYKEIEEIDYKAQYTNDEKKQILEQVTKAESLEKFLHTRYVGMKRFSIEGGDALIPMLFHMTNKGRTLNIEEMVLGMAHRGRINVLANFMGKAFHTVLSEFEGIIATDGSDEFEGDVKYHLGFSTDKETPNGNFHISLAFNPSHLEAVAPVALGMTRAKQRVRKNTEIRDKVVPVIVHGDAAFIGQGVVAETFQLSQLEGYTIGGTVHIVINNQVGFTTSPKDSRSTTYCSDIAKSINAPVFLVNGDDVEACVRAMDIAIRFRQEFKQDVVIDLVCYRRFGHNEGDEPSFTQPELYKKIKKHPTLMKQYSELLIQSGVISKEDFKTMYDGQIKNLQTVLDEVRNTPASLSSDTLGGLWKGLKRGTLKDFETPCKTTVTLKKLQAVSEPLTQEPKVKVLSKLKKLIALRKKMFEEDRLDWAMGELLAYGTLLEEGHSVRLSGQDCKRGTFTHRHSVYFDSENGEEEVPLSSINPETEFCVYNSSLSEMAVLGFEYGNSSSDPHFLTIWEAQFGDFANGAQTIIDQFISSAETKWSRMSGLVMLLPHGYEGQGPEHSSARLERFLQLCAQTNIQVCNITTPSNFFHALRRQIKRDFRKPLVVMSPKSLLRHPMAVSTKKDFTTGGFQEVIEDSNIKNHKDVETLVLSTGKIYYDLLTARETANPKSQKAALTRLEQIYPFPDYILNGLISGYENLKKIIWVQEEPKNMGAYFFVKPEIDEMIENLGLKLEVNYIGRRKSASPATGSSKTHVSEQDEIIQSVARYF